MNTVADKVDGINEYDWQEIIAKYNIPLHYDSLRKASQTIFGGVFVKKYFADKKISNDSVIAEIEQKRLELEKERQKRNAVNIEWNRNIRQQSRFELLYENVANVVKQLPCPNYINVNKMTENLQDEKKYVLTIADIHAGACFESENNSYSMAEVVRRFNVLLDRTVDYVLKNDITHMKVVFLGDAIQGVIRISDVKMNETTVVKAIVDISRIVANFINELSTYCTVDYYHSPTANHTQIRPLGTKANELACEDVEYIIGNYIKDMVCCNDRISVHTNFGKEYIAFKIFDFECIAMHGHTIKNLENSIKNLSILHRKFYDFCFLGHFHAGRQITANEGGTYDTEVLVAPSFVGSDPYSDSLMKGCKGSCIIYGFDKNDGHTDTYKIVLNGGVKI